MKPWVMIVAGIVCAAAQCHTEPRWCSITGRGANDTMVYPPIARAARVQGVVVSRIVYAQNGEVVRMEPVFGPAMLSDSVSKQLSQWNIKTDATGGELCQSLIIADFRLDVPGTSRPSVSIQLENGSTLRVISQTQSICLCDPGGVLGPKPSIVRRVWLSVRHLAGRVFCRHLESWY